jgi:hypothetical protein
VYPPPLLRGEDRLSDNALSVCPLRLDGSLRGVGSGSTREDGRPLLGRGEGVCPWEKESRFEGVDGNGICSGAVVQEERARGMAEGEERTGIGRGRGDG